ncbi:MAG: transcriptional repressor [Tannerella sp.]|jgi:Fe2+ or Zn2+ uptake regulation protein|nr:transcriptional repressor [Tannerella sp.]
MDKQKRNTKTKQRVMAVLSDSSSALCHEDIERKLPEKVDRATIYRILQGFCDDGKVHKISGENGKTYYALCHHCDAGNHSDHHLHFQCVGCETVFCLDEPVSPPALPSGYRALDVSCTVSGYCPDCLNR